MTRIIAGVAGGRRIATLGQRHPAHQRPGPRGDLLPARARGPARGGPGADLYAGSGALGLEACSRGCRRGALVESSRAAAQIISGNIRDRAAPGARRHPAGRDPPRCGPSGGAGTGFDVVLSDPPYDLGDGALHADLVFWSTTGGWRRRPWSWSSGRRARASCAGRTVSSRWHKRYGETSVWYAEVTDSAGATDCAEATDTVEP